MRRSVFGMGLMMTFFAWQGLQATEVPTASGDLAYDELYKIAMVGDLGVGKTQLGRVYARLAAKGGQKSIATVDFAAAMESIGGGAIINLQLWDTAGQERARSVGASYYRGAHGACLVYDIHNPESFANLSYWLKEVRNHTEPDAVLFLVGTHSDLSIRPRSVSTAIAKAFAEQNGMGFFEVSSVTGANVQTLFHNMARHIYDGTSPCESESAPVITRRPHRGTANHGSWGHHHGGWGGGHGGWGHHHGGRHGGGGWNRGGYYGGRGGCC
jgi:Ras-related protein Rab-11A